MYNLNELKISLIKLINFLFYDDEFKDEFSFEILKYIVPDLDDDLVVLLINDIKELTNDGGFDILCDVCESVDLKELDKMIKEQQKFKTKKELKLLQRKKELLKKIGDRANSIEFKKNYYFDKEKKRFVKRDKPLDVKVLKKKAKVMKKLHKKQDFKNKIKRAKERYKHIKD